MPKIIQITWRRLLLAQAGGNWRTNWL